MTTWENLTTYRPPVAPRRRPVWSTRAWKLAELPAIFMGLPLVAALMPVEAMVKFAMFAGFLLLAIAHTRYRRVPCEELGLGECGLRGLTPSVVHGALLGGAFLGVLLVLRLVGRLPLWDPYDISPLGLTLFLLIYPIWAAGQEFVYRSWFFWRYRDTLPEHHLLIVNAMLFGWLHLAYGYWETVVLCTVGGLLFAWAYRRFNSLWGVSVIHAVAGAAMYFCGFGRFFNF